MASLTLSPSRTFHYRGIAMRFARFFFNEPQLKKRSHCGHVLLVIKVILIMLYALPHALKWHRGGLVTTIIHGRNSKQNKGLHNECKPISGSVK